MRNLPTLERTNTGSQRKKRPAAGQSFGETVPRTQNRQPIPQGAGMEQIEQTQLCNRCKQEFSPRVSATGKKNNQFYYCPACISTAVCKHLSKKRVYRFRLDIDFTRGDMVEVIGLDDELACQEIRDDLRRVYLHSCFHPEDFNLSIEDHVFDGLVVALNGSRFVIRAGRIVKL